MIDQERLQKIREEERLVRQNIREKVVGYILAAFGLVAGLAWNNAVTAAINQFFPVGQGVLAKFIYAIVLSIVVAIVAYYVTKLFVGEKKS